MFTDRLGNDGMVTDEHFYRWKGVPWECGHVLYGVYTRKPSLHTQPDNSVQTLMAITDTGVGTFVKS